MKKLLYTAFLLFISCKIAYGGSTKTTDEKNKITLKIVKKANTDVFKKIRFAIGDYTTYGFFHSLQDTQFYKNINPHLLNCDLYHNNVKLEPNKKFKEYKIQDQDEILIDFFVNVHLHSEYSNENLQCPMYISQTINDLKNKAEFKKLKKNNQVKLSYHDGIKLKYVEKEDMKLDNLSIQQGVIYLRVENNESESNGTKPNSDSNNANGNDSQTSHASKDNDAKKPNNSSNSNNDSPKTADGSMRYMWLAIPVLAAVILGPDLLPKKKATRKNKSKRKKAKR